MRLSNAPDVPRLTASCTIGPASGAAVPRRDDISAGVVLHTVAGSSGRPIRVLRAWWGPIFKGTGMTHQLANIIGILATAILVATLVGQTVKQWHERTTRGVARWFFLGQVSASLGFIAYSLMVGSILFAVTNALILLSAVAGYVVLRMNRRRIAGPPRVSFSDRIGDGHLAAQ
jgi:MtN3 and saliva related transmembrane protein